MTQLYKIKPLEWAQVLSHPFVTWAAGPYEIEKNDTRVFLWEHLTGKRTFSATGQCSTLEGAKAACESHRRKLLEAELEPACQPATELPTGPGLYWFRLKGDSEWDSRRVIKQRGLQVYDELLESSYKPPIGQWIRIPEPEERP